MPLFRPQVVQLESRDTPSSFAPASSVVTFLPPPPPPGVPFVEMEVTPPNGLPIYMFPNYTGFNESVAALDNAGVWGCPAVVLGEAF